MAKKATAIESIHIIAFTSFQKFQSAFIKGNHFSIFQNTSFCNAFFRPFIPWFIMFFPGIPIFQKMFYFSRNTSGFRFFYCYNAKHISYMFSSVRKLFDYFSIKKRSRIIVSMKNGKPVTIKPKFFSNRNICRVSIPPVFSFIFCYMAFFSPFIKCFVPIPKMYYRHSVIRLIP